MRNWIIGLLFLLSLVSAVHAADEIQTYQYCFPDGCFTFAVESALYQPVYDQTMACLKRVEAGYEAFCDDMSTTPYRQVVELKDGCQMPYSEALADKLANCDGGTCYYYPCYQKMEDAFNVGIKAAGQAYNDWVAAGKPKTPVDQALKDEYDQVYAQYETVYAAAKELADEAKRLCFDSGACTLSCTSDAERIRCTQLDCINPEKVFDGKKVCETITQSAAAWSNQRVALESQIDSLKKKITDFESTGNTTDVEANATQLEATIDSQFGTDAAIITIAQKAEEQQTEAPKDENQETTTGAKETVGEGLSPEPTKRAERMFRPLFGRLPNEKPGVEISTHGYPMASVMTSFFAIYRHADGETYLTNIETQASVLFEGIGAHQGEEASLPVIDASSFGVGSNLTGRIEGLESIASSASVEPFIDAQQIAWLYPKLALNANAPVGEHLAKLVIDQNGVSIAEIQFSVDVDKVPEADLVGGMITSLILLAVLAAVVYGIYRFKFAKKTILKAGALPERPQKKPVAQLNKSAPTETKKK